jgi:mannose-1-phosphate guanylyltransferase
MYALIMAGGTGSRLWPRSRLLLPKQFLDITGDLTMLQLAQRRLEPMIPQANTLIATNQSYVDIVERQLPDLPTANILGEPVGRGTAAAIGLAAIHIRRRDPNGVMAVLTADHLIKQPQTFRQVLEAGSHIAQEDWLVTLGIQPGYPETGYGYIERGEFLGMIGDFEGFEVARFVEKPDLARARTYVESGSYAWNSGMFIWKVARILDEMSRHMPELYAGLSQIEASFETAEAEDVLQRVFPTLPNETIDYGIMEKAEQVAMLPVEIGWNDVGSWSAVYDVLPRDQADNVVVGRHLTPDTTGSLIYSPSRLVATVGLEDLVVVDTEDVLLILPRGRSQDVKKLVNMLKDNGESDYLRGSVTPQPVTSKDIQAIFGIAESQERLLLSLIVHAGLWPSQIISLKDGDFDLIGGWVHTNQSTRPLPDVTRQEVFSWMKTQNSMTFDLGDTWRTSSDVKDAIMQLGERADSSVTVDELFESLARALFDTSEEGQSIRSVLGEEANLVRVPLSALFPFSITDFKGKEDSGLARRALAALNEAARSL